MSADWTDEGEEWREESRPPVIQFQRGERVPEWIERVTPRKYQRHLRFTVDAEARILAEAVEVRPLGLCPDGLVMLLRLPWWQRLWRRKFGPVNLRVPFVEIRGYPTIIHGATKFLPPS